MARLSSMRRSATVVGLATGLVALTMLTTGAAQSLASVGHSGNQTSRSQANAASDKSNARPVAKPASPAALAQQAGMQVAWRATSPATQPGDHYRLVLTNGSTPQRVTVRTMIMDHANQVNTAVVQEDLRLAAGERRDLAAANEYGRANHFTTAVAAQTEDLQFQVTLKDSSGAETARFNERAFMVRKGGPANRGQQEHQPHKQRAQ